MGIPCVAKSEHFRKRAHNGSLYPEAPPRMEARAANNDKIGMVLGTDSGTALPGNLGVYEYGYDLVLLQNAAQTMHNIIHNFLLFITFYYS